MHVIPAAWEQNQKGHSPKAGLGKSAKPYMKNYTKKQKDLGMV
jgi:hypothetical protein